MEHFQTVDLPKESPRLVGDCLVSIYQFFSSNFNFPNPSNLPEHFIFYSTSTYPLRKNMSFQNAQKSPWPNIYTKPPNSDYGFKHRDLALLETLPRYWQKGRVKQRQTRLHLYPRLRKKKERNFLA